MSTFAKFKFNSKPEDIINALKYQMNETLEKARSEIAEFLYKELYTTSPRDTTTFKHSWKVPEEIKLGYQIINALPSHYVAKGDYHSSWQRIVEPYNLYILEGFKAGAPSDFGYTRNGWEYINQSIGKLQDVNILLWKFNQGMLGLNPYTTLNEIFFKKVRSKY
jgi:hypothetical protein